MKITALLVVFLLHFATPLLAAKWEVDADHSSIGFTIKHLMVANVSGQFSQFKGWIDLDDKEVSKTTTEIVIQTNSISTQNKKRDDHLKNADFFDTKKYPTITFKSKKAEGNSPSKFRLTGDLTMHGVTKEVTFDVESSETLVKDPWGNTRRGLTANAEINRQDFGIKWSKSMDGGGAVLGDTVKVRVDFSLMMADKTPSKKKG